MGQVEEALDLLQEKQKQATDDEKFMIADLYYENGFFDEAITVLNQLLKKYPNDGQLLTRLAEMHIELEEDEFAIQLLNDVTEDDPAYVASLIQLADLYQAQGLFEVSEQKLLTAKNIAPDEKVIDFALAELFFSMGDLGRAIVHYEKLKAHVEEINNIAISERLAECHALLGHYEKALAYYMDMDTSDPDKMFKYGFTAQQAERNEIAIAQWERLLEVDPHYHAAYYHLANVLKEENMFEKAYDISLQGISYDNFNKELYFLAGELASHLQQEEKAIEYLEEAIALDSDYQEAILLLVQIYSNNHQYENIIELLTSIQETGVTDPIYDWELAKAYKEEELYDQALNSYQQASSYLQHDSDFLEEYGYYLVEEGRTEEALPILQKYMQLVPEDEDVFSFIERLKLSSDE